MTSKFYNQNTSICWIDHLSSCHIFSYFIILTYTLKWRYYNAFACSATPYFIFSFFPLKELPTQEIQTTASILLIMTICTHTLVFVCYITKCKQFRKRSIFKHQNKSVFQWNNRHNLLILPQEHILLVL